MTAAVVALLDGLYATLADRESAACIDYTNLVLDTVYATLGPAERDTYPDTLRAFAILHHDDLVRLIHDYGPDSPLGRLGEYELAGSPAVIAVCERLTVKPLHLEAVWQQQWESSTPLEDIEAAWA